MGRNRVSRRCGRAWQNIACAFDSADEAAQGGRTICWSSSDRAPETAAAHSEAGVTRVGVVLEADARVARAQLVLALPPLLYLAHRRRLVLAHQVGQQPDRRVVAQLPRLALAHAPRHRAAYVVGVVAQRAWMVRRSEMATWAACGWKVHGLSVVSEALGLSCRVRRRAAHSLQMQADEPVVASYGLTKTAALTTLACGAAAPSGRAPAAARSSPPRSAPA